MKFVLAFQQSNTFWKIDNQIIIFMNMKKYYLILSVILMTVCNISFVSCDDDDDDNGPGTPPITEQQILGTWHHTKKIYNNVENGESIESDATQGIDQIVLEFRQGGIFNSYVCTKEGDELKVIYIQPGRWKLEENTLKFNFDSESNEHDRVYTTLYCDDNTLVLKYNSDISSTDHYTKVTNELTFDNNSPITKEQMLGKWHYTKGVTKIYENGQVVEAIESDPTKEIDQTILEFIDGGKFISYVCVKENGKFKVTNKQLGRWTINENMLAFKFDSEESGNVRKSLVLACDENTFVRRTLSGNTYESLDYCTKIDDELILDEYTPVSQEQILGKWQLSKRIGTKFENGEAVATQEISSADETTQYVMEIIEGGVFKMHTCAKEGDKLAVVTTKAGEWTLKENILSYNFDNESGFYTRTILSCNENTLLIKYNDNAEGVEIKEEFTIVNNELILN